MPPDEQADGAYLPYRVRELERRLDRVDDLKLDVLAERVVEMREDVQSLRRAFYTFAFSVVGSAIVFAFTVFGLLGR